MSRRAAVLILVGAAATVAAAAGLVALASGSSSPASTAGAYRGSVPPPGIEMADFSLRNYDGRVVRSSDLRAGVTVLTFLDSQCTDACPTIAWTVARTLDALEPSERQDVRAVAITVDPDGDGARSVRGFLGRNHALGRLLYLGGGQSVSELRDVWSEFQVLSSLDSGSDTMHSAPVRIYDRTGQWVATLSAGADLSEAGLAHDIRAALRSGVADES